MLVETRIVATQNRVTVVHAWVLPRGEDAIGETSGVDFSVTSGTAVLDRNELLGVGVACIQAQRLQKVLL